MRETYTVWHVAAMRFMHVVAVVAALGSPAFADKPRELLDEA